MSLPLSVSFFIAVADIDIDSVDLQAAYEADQLQEVKGFSLGMFGQMPEDDELKMVAFRYLVHAIQQEDYSCDEVNVIAFQHGDKTRFFSFNKVAQFIETAPQRDDFGELCLDVDIESAEEFDDLLSVVHEKHPAFKLEN